MRTTYVVLVLTILSAASSYGWELGVQGGVRDWEESTQASLRPTPQVMLTLGKHVSTTSPIRIDGVAGLWSQRTVETGPEMIQNQLDDNPPSHEGYHYEESKIGHEWPGFMFGGRVVLDGQARRDNGRRAVRPMVGAGLLWTVQEDKKYDQLYWHDRWTGEGLLGVAIPVGRAADFMVQYGFANNFNDDDQATQYLTVGYRFSVMD